MAEPLSPLKRYLKADHAGAKTESPITLGERPLGPLWQISGWKAFETAASPALAKCGLQGLGTYAETRHVADVTAFRTAPDKVLIEGATDLGAYMNEDLAVLDLSFSKSVITLSGQEVRTLLAQLCSVDVGPDALKPGQFIQTGMHHIAVLVSCVADDAFEIYAPVTWAASLWETICHNAKPFGYIVEDKAA